MTARGFATLAALQHGVEVSDIFQAGRRWREVQQARWEAWRLARAAGWTFARIGREFGVHHTSVMHALRRTA